MTEPVAAAPPAAGLARRRARDLLLLVFVCAALCALVYLVAVQTVRGQRIDGDALAGRAVNRPRVQEATGNLLETISIASITLVGGALILVALIRRLLAVAVGVAVVIAGANITTQILKDVLPRPDLVSNDVLGPLNSYPSGHATVAISLAVAAVLASPVHIRGLVAMAGTAYAALVGMGTVTAGWHRPSDVVGAALVGVGWGAGVAAVLMDVRGSRRARGSPAGARAVGPLLAGVGTTLLIAVFLAIVGTAFAIRRGRLDAVDLTFAYWVSLAAIAGAVSLLMAVFLFLLRGVRLDRPAGVAAAA